MNSFDNQRSEISVKVRTYPENLVSEYFSLEHGSTNTGANTFHIREERVDHENSGKVHKVSILAIGDMIQS